VKMLSLDDPEWDTLKHAYGFADDVPSRLAKLKANPSNTSENEQIWYEFYGDITHQGTVYSAAIAAIPHIIETISLHPSSVTSDFFYFPAYVDVNRRTFDWSLGGVAVIPKNLKEAYLEAIKKLPELVIQLADIRIKKKEEAAQKEQQAVKESADKGEETDKQFWTAVTGAIAVGGGCWKLGSLLIDCFDCNGTLALQFWDWYVDEYEGKRREYPQDTQADQIPGLVEQLKAFPKESEALWPKVIGGLIPNGTNSPAAFEAVPQIIAAISAHLPLATSSYFEFPILVEISRLKHQVEVPGHLSEAYFSALKQLPRLTITAASLHNEKVKKPIQPQGAGPEEEEEEEEGPKVKKARLNEDVDEGKPEDEERWDYGFTALAIAAYSVVFEKNWDLTEVILVLKDDENLIDKIREAELDLN